MSELVAIQVTVYKYPCDQCKQPMWWILWLSPAQPEPAAWPKYDGTDEVDDFGAVVPVEQPFAVKVTRRVLAEMGSQRRANQLVDRPADAVGASFNANRCYHCGYLAEWHTFEAVIIAASYNSQRTRSRAVKVPLDAWAVLANERHGLWDITEDY